MSKIGQNGAGHQSPGSASFGLGEGQGGSPFRHGKPGEGRRPGDGLGTRGETGRGWGQAGAEHHGAGHEDPRAALFRQHVERATHDQGQGGRQAGDRQAGHDRDKHQDHDRSGAKVLAQAGETPTVVIPAAPMPGAAPLPQAAPPVAAPAPGTTAEQAATDKRVQGMAAWVDHALRTEVVPEKGAPLTLSIPLDTAAAGVTGVTLLATAEGLDITLVRNAGQPDAALASAAAELAETIQRRVGKRVRVLDAAAAHKTGMASLGAFGGLGAFSAMLAPTLTVDDD